MDYGNGLATSDSGTPGLSGSIGLRKGFDLGRMPASFDLFATGESGAKLRDETGTVIDTAAGWGTVNLRGALDISDHATVSVQLNNIFDRAYNPFDQLPGGERSIDVVLSARF